MNKGFKETKIGLIPEDWEIKAFSDIGEVVGGGTPKTTNPDYWGGDIPWLTPKDLSNYNYVFIEKGERNITNLGLKNSSARLLPKGTVLFTSRAPIGYVAIAKNQISTNQGFKSIICHKNRVNNKFIYYALKYYKEAIEIIAVGSTFKEVSGKVLKEFEIPIPPLNEQKKISDVLFSIDKKIELNLQMNQTLEAIGQAIFQHWFINYEFPDEEGKPYKSNGGEMINSELGEIPAGWKVGKLGDLITITSGKRPKEKSEEKKGEFNIPLIGASSLMGFVQEILYNEPVLVIGRVGTLGIVQKIMSPSFPSDNTLVIRSKYYEFVYQILTKIDYDSLNVGTTQPLITQKSIKNQDIIVPPLDILKKFEIITSNLFLKVNNNNLEIKDLSQIRDALLPKLMSGKIRVIPEKEAVG